MDFCGIIEIINLDEKMALLITHIVLNDIYKLCPKSKFITHALKFLEDRIFYSYINDWKTVIGYFDEILADELDFGISEDYLAQWHRLLQEYFEQKPTNQTILSFAEKLNFSKNDATEIIKNIDIIKNNDKIIEIIKGLYDNFDFLLEKK